MDLSLARLSKAGKPGPDNRRIYCNADGVFIGPDCALIRAEPARAGRKSYMLRPRSEIAYLLDAGYGTHLGADSVISSLNVIAKALDDGNATLAMIATLQLGLPELPDGAAATRMAAADRLLKYNFNPDEPRDSHGRWTTDGGAGAEAQPQLVTQNVPSPATAQDDPPKLVHVAGYPDSTSPVPNPEIRQTDPYGAGGFNERRDNGRRHHHGVDLVAPPGTPVTSPVSGRIAIFDPYGRDATKRGNFSAVQITTDDGYVVRLMYINTDDLENGQDVEAGDTLGAVEDLSEVYPPKKEGAMTNHVHFDIRRGETYLDPTPLVDAWQNEP